MMNKLKRMKRLLLVMGMLGTTAAFAQHEYSSFTATGRGGATTFVTDYQAIGINPANLGWTWDFEEKKVAMGFSEFSYSMYSEALSKQELRDNFKAMIGGDAEEFTHAEKIQAGQDFANSPFSMNFDFGSFGFAFTTESAGGFAFGIRDRFQWNSTLSKNASEILFQGYTAPYFDSLVIVDQNQIATTIANYENISTDTLAMIQSGFSALPRLMSDVLNGTSINMSWTREYGFSYGVKLLETEDVFALYAGAGIKFVQGIGLVSVDVNGGNLEAFSALSPRFDIDYGSAALSNPSAIAKETTGLPSPVGKGWGFDFGFNMTIKNKLKIGAAITNIGSVTWDGNVYTATDTLIYDSQNGGIDSYNIFGEVDDIIGDNGLFKWGGVAEKEVSLPTTARVGASLVIGEKLEVGMDVILPIGDEVPGSYEKAVIGFGGDFSPIPQIQLSGGFLTGGNYDFQIPVGVTFILGDGTWEAGIASRDMITFFAKNGPTISLSTGFMRFRF
jgi:hypothetical protein